MLSKIAKYTVEAEIGRGGFGRVYRAYDPDVQRQVAIKVLTAEEDPELLKRFQAEIGTTGSLHHRNIVTLYECGEQSGVPYLVMELLEGQTLHEIIKTGVVLTLLDKTRILMQIAQGLAYAHSKGVIHRDVKPGNIMLLPDGTVKIMDFGIARVATRNTMLTREGYIIGTIPYMAPEQFDGGGKADEQTDIFAYGAVCYELLTGKHPFSEEADVYATIQRITSFEPKAVSLIVEGCPESLELVVHRAIAKDRGVRYQRFGELLMDSEANLVDLQQERANAILAEVAPLLAAGDLQSADNKVRDVLELNPANREARLIRQKIKRELEERAMRLRVASLLAEAETQMRERKYPQAVQILEAALRLDKSDEIIQARLAEANSKLNGHLQANKLVAEARRDQQRGHLGDALQRLKMALQLDSDHTDAGMLCRRVEAELERRAKEQQMQEAINAASQHLAKKRYDEALSALSKAEEEHPLPVGIAELRRHIEREKQADERRKRSDQFKVVISKIRLALQAHELTTAADLLDNLSADFAGEVGFDELRAELRSQLDAQIRAHAVLTCSQQAQEMLRRGSFREALVVLGEALQRFPEDTGLQRLRESAQERLEAQQQSEAIAAVLKEAAARRDAEDFTGALEIIERGRTSLGDVTELIDLTRQLELEIEQQRYAAGLKRVLMAGNDLISAGKYAEAIRVIEDANDYKQESEVQGLLSSARAAVAMQQEQQDVEASLDVGRGFEQKGEWDRALRVLQEALRNYPQNLALSRAAARIEDEIAEEQRRARTANHRSLIESAIEEKNWDKARIAVRSARSECPEEGIFETYAEQVERASFEAGLEAVAEEVHDRLTANELAKAAEQLNLTRTIYSGAPRWKSLQEEVANRQRHESKERWAAELDSLLLAGDMDGAAVALEKAAAEFPGQFEHARERIRELLEARSLLSEACALASRGRAAEASRTFRSAYQAVPHNTVFQKSILDSLIEQAAISIPVDWRIAEAYVQVARTLDQATSIPKEISAAIEEGGRKESVSALLARATELKESKNFKVALQEIELGLANYPGDASLVQGRAAIVEAESQYERQCERERRLRRVRELTLIAEGNVENAQIKNISKELRTILERHSPDEEISGVANTVLQQLSDLKEARTQVASGNVPAARGLCGKYQDRSPVPAGFLAVQEQIAESERRAAVAFMKKVRERLSADGDMENCLQILTDANTRYPHEAYYLDELKLLRNKQELALAKKEAPAIQALVEEPFAANSSSTHAGGGKSGTAWDDKSEPVANALTPANNQDLLERRNALETEVRKNIDPGERPPAFESLRWLTRKQSLIGSALAAVLIAGIFTIWRLNRLSSDISLEITSNISGALVKVGAKTCLTPDCALKLPAGSYEILATKNGFKPLALTQTVSRGQSDVKLPLVFEPLPQAFQVNTNFENGLVFLDGRQVGDLRDGQFTLSDVRYGLHTIRVTGGGSDFQAEWRSAVGTPPEIITPLLTKAVDATVVSTAGEAGTLWCNCVIRNLAVDDVPVEGKAASEGTLISLRHLKMGLNRISAANRSVVVNVPANPVLNIFLAADRNVGTLVIQTGIDNARVFLNDRLYPRLTNQGNLRIPSLAVGQYLLRVEKERFRPVATQRVDVLKGQDKQVVFALTPLPAALEIAGALPGAQVNVDGHPIGVTDAQGAIRKEVGGGEHLIEITKDDYTAARFRTKFLPGEVSRPAAAQLRMSRLIAPTPSPDPKQIEAQDWERIRNGTIDEIESFVRRYPSGTHLEEARNRLLQLRQQAQAETTRKAEETAWNNVDKRNKAALEEFLKTHSNSQYAAAARNSIGEIEKQEKDAVGASQLAKQQADLQESLRLAALQKEADQRGILATLRAYESAFTNKNPKEVRRLFPQVPRATAEALRTSDSVKVVFSQVSKLVVNGDTATLDCMRSVQQKYRGVTTPSQEDRVRIVMNRIGSTWLIGSIQ